MPRCEKLATCVRAGGSESAARATDQRIEALTERPALADAPGIGSLERVRVGTCPIYSRCWVRHVNEFRTNAAISKSPAAISHGVTAARLNPAVISIWRRAPPSTRAPSVQGGERARRL